MSARRFSQSGIHLCDGSGSLSNIGWVLRKYRDCAGPHSASSDCRMHRRPATDGLCLEQSNLVWIFCGNDDHHDAFGFFQLHRRQ